MGASSRSPAGSQQTQPSAAVFGSTPPTPARAPGRAPEFVASDYPPVEWAGPQPTDGRSAVYAARAYLHVVGQGERHALAPNDAGIFSRTFVEPGAEVEVHVKYPWGAEGDVVSMAMLDGGVFSNGANSQAVTLGADGLLSALATVSTNAGTHRIRVFDGVNSLTVELWAGPDNTYSQQ